METSKGITYPVFTVLTKEPSQSVGFIHDRMPVILPLSSVGDWIDPNNKAESVLGYALSDMVVEKTS